MFQPTADVGSQARPETARDPVMVVTTWVAGIAAAVASFAALYQLARHTGWPDYTAWLYPLTIDAYAVSALRVWLSRGTRNTEARRRARRCAVGAIVASVAGNAALHAAVAHVYVITWPVVVAVAATPPIVLGLVSHLFALRALPAAEPVTSLVDAVDTTATPELPAWASSGPTRELPEPVTAAGFPELPAAEVVSRPDTGIWPTFQEPPGLPAAAELPELPTAAELPELPTAAELAGLSKAEAIRIALRHCDGNVIDAQAWLADIGITVDRAYCHDVKAGRSGQRRRNRGTPVAVPGEVAA
jgi:Protein of unknown function (DUF2637)